MIKNLSLSLLMSTLLFVSGCATYPQTPNTVVMQKTILLSSTANDPNALISREFSTAPFNCLNANGNFRIIVKANQKYPCVIITGLQSEVNGTSVTLNNGILSITEKTHRHHWGVKQLLNPLTVEVDTMYLNSVTLSGPTVLSSQDIGPQGLNLTVSGNATANITNHHVVLGQLNVGDNSRVSIYWIDSNFVKVNAEDGAKIALAGVATNLNANLIGDSNLNAKYLRTQQAYISTADDANASVFVLNSLSALATDDSTIYYYPDPEIVGRYVSGSGTVLRMAGLPY